MNIPDPLYKQVELRAYQLWQERGEPWGTPEADWFKAEQELTADDPENPLSSVARKVGAALGNVVAFLTDLDDPTPHDPS